MPYFSLWGHVFPCGGQVGVTLNSPPVLQSYGHVASTIIPQNSSDSFIFHILKGFHDWSILANDKEGKTIDTNRATRHPVCHSNQPKAIWRCNSCKRFGRWRWPASFATTWIISPRYSRWWCVKWMSRKAPDILFLRHACCILRQSSNQVCGLSIMMEQVGLCTVWPTENMLFHEPHTRLEDCLRMLQGGIRKRISGLSSGTHRVKIPSLGQYWLLFQVQSLRILSRRDGDPKNQSHGVPRAVLLYVVHRITEMERDVVVFFNFSKCHFFLFSLDLKHSLFAF